MKKTGIMIAGCLAITVMFTACGNRNTVEDAAIEAETEKETADSDLIQGLNAVENAIAAGKENSTEETGDDMGDLRAGTSADTIATPDDFPAEYDYGSGKISDYSRDNMLRKLPKPDGNNTVLNTEADAKNIQVLYLWEKGNVPARTAFTKDMTGYFDDYDFRPYVTSIPVREGVQAKGAVVLMAGGAYQFRGNYTDSLPTAAALREQGFQTFIVDYRLHPYTQEEGALDVARAVRFIRKNADVYGINPDELDEIPAHASAAGMIYSFYGRLSVGNMDAEWLAEGDLPPTYYVYGTEDPFYDQFERQYDVISGMGIQTDRIVLNGWPHGFGSDGGWVKDYADWLENIFTNLKLGNCETSSQS